MYIDEAQSWTLKQLLEIMKWSHNHQVMFFGDPLQELTLCVSIFPQLLSAIYKLTGAKDRLVELDMTYRNPEEVIQSANNVLKLRRLFIGGKNGAYESVKLINPLQHPSNKEIPVVTWLQDIDKQMKEVTQLVNQSGAMVITNNVAKTKACFPDAFVTSPQLAQGLETDFVLVYLLIPDDIIKKMNKALKARLEKPTKDNTNQSKHSDDDTNEFTHYLNQLFTALTRVNPIGRLLIYLGEPNRDRAQLFEYLQIGLGQNNNTLEALTHLIVPKTREKTIEWIKSIYAIESDDAKQQAKQLFLQHVQKDQLQARFEFAQHIEPNEDIITKLFGKLPAVSPASATSVTTVIPRKKSAKKKSIQQEKPVTQSVEPQKPSALDLYFIKLVEHCTFEGLKTLFSHADVQRYVSKQFKLGNRTTTIIPALLANQSCRRELLAFLKNRHLTLPVDNLPVLISEITSTSDGDNSAQLLLKHWMDQDLDIPGFINETNLKDLLNFLLPKKGADAVLAYQLIYDITLSNPLLFKKLIQNENKLGKKSSLISWLVYLLSSPEGSAVLIHLCFTYPTLLKSLDLQDLTKKEFNILADGSSLFFYLVTTHQGIRLFNQFLEALPRLKRTFTQEIFLNLKNHCSPLYQNTNFLFWMLSVGGVGTLNSLKEDNPEQFKGTILAFRAQKFMHPQVLDQIVSGEDILTSVQTSVNPAHFIPVVPPPAHPHFSRSQPLISKHHEVINHLASLQPDDPLYTAALESLLNSDDAEELLFDVYDCSCVFVKIISNHAAYNILLNLLAKNPQYAKLFTAKNLNTHMVFEYESDTPGSMSLLNWACIVPVDRKSTARLLQQLPNLASDLRQSTPNALFSPTVIEYAPGKMRLDNLFGTLCTTFELSSCVGPFISPEDLTDSFFQQLYFSSTEPSNTIFNNLIINQPDLLVSWILKNKKLLKYFSDTSFTYLFMPPKYSDNPEAKRHATLFDLMISRKKDGDILDLMLEHCEVLFKTSFNYMSLTECSVKSNSLFHLLSKTESGCAFLCKLLSLLGEGKLSPAILDEKSLDNPDKTTLDYLLENETGIALLGQLFLNETKSQFIEQFKAAKLVAFSTQKERDIVLKLCSSVKGIALLLLLFMKHPQCFKELTTDLFYTAIGTFPAKSIFLKLIYTCQSQNKKGNFSLIDMILSANPQLIQLSPADAQSKTAEERRCLTMSIQLQQLSTEERKQLKDAFTMLEPKPKIDIPADVNSSLLKLMSVSNEEQRKKIIINQINFAKTSDQSNNVKRFVSLLNTMMFEQEYFKLLNDLLWENTFLTFGDIMRSDSKPLEAVLKYASCTAPDLTQFFRLCSFLLTHAPHNSYLHYAINKNTITPELLLLLSSSPEGRSLLLQLINANPNGFPTILQSHKNTSDWMTALFDNLTGCQIVYKLFKMFPGKSQHTLWKCMNVNHVINRLELMNNHSPMFFWLAATEDGNRVLAGLLDYNPEIRKRLNAEQLMVPIICDDPVYNGTTALYWLCQHEPEYRILQNMSPMASEILDIPVTHPLAHPLYSSQAEFTVGSFIQYQNKRRNETRPQLPVEMAPHIMHMNNPGNFNGSGEELQMILAVTKKTSTLKNLKKVLEHEHAESLLFDCIPSRKYSLFAMIASDSSSTKLFFEILKSNHEYFKLFNLKRLNQIVSFRGEIACTVLYYILLNYDNFLYDLLIKDSQLGEQFDQEFLLTPIGEDPLEKKVPINLLNFLSRKKSSTSALELLDPKHVSLRMLNSLSIRTGLLPLTKYSYLDFLILCFYQPTVGLKWVTYQPMILSLLTKEDTVSQPFPEDYKDVFFHTLLCSTEVGIQLAAIMIKTRPELFHAIKVQDLFVRRNQFNSTFYYLKQSEAGKEIIKILSGIIPNLQARITDGVLDETDIKTNIKPEFNRHAFFQSIGMRQGNEISEIDGPSPN